MDLLNLREFAGGALQEKANGAMPEGPGKHAGSQYPL